MSGMQAGLSGDYHYMVVELRRENAMLREVLEAAEDLIAHDDNDLDAGLTAQSYDAAWSKLRKAVDEVDERGLYANIYAAAPALLKVCKDIINVYENADGSSASETLDAAYAAVARAEGKS